MVSENSGDCADSAWTGIVDPGPIGTGNHGTLLTQRKMQYSAANTAKEGSGG